MLLLEIKDLCQADVHGFGLLVHSLNVQQVEIDQRLLLPDLSRHVEPLLVVARKRFRKGTLHLVKGPLLLSQNHGQDSQLILNILAFDKQTRLLGYIQESVNKSISPAEPHGFVVFFQPLILVILQIFGISFMIYGCLQRLSSFIVCLEPMCCHR